MSRKRIFVSTCDGGFLISGYEVDDPTESLVVGNVYTLSATTDCSSKFCLPFGCYVIQEISEPKTILPDTILIDSYGPEKPNGCTDCLAANSNFLEFQACVFNGISNIYIPINQITPTPSINQVYFLDFLIGGFGQTEQYQGCFTLVGFSITARQEGEIFVTSYSGQTDCQTCIDNSPLFYVIEPCTTTITTIVVSLPSSGYENHLITYTGLDGLTQYCGIVKQPSSPPANHLFVTDLGLYNDTNNNCDDCLSNVNEKKKLVNCLGGPDQIVWASTLFEPGNSTHLSFGDGCYEISTDVVPPGEPVTLNELANFDPQGDCEDCLECYGLIYDYVSCEQLEVCGPINLFDSSLSTLYSGRDFKIDSNDFAFVPFRDSQRIAKINLNTQTIVAQSNFVLNSPESLDIDETNGVICVSNTTSFIYPQYNITFFDYTNLSLSFNITISGAIPNKIYFNPNDGYFYVTTSAIGFPLAATILVYNGTSYNTMSFVGGFGNTFTSYSDIIQIGSLIYTLNSTNNTLEIYNQSPSWTFVNQYSLGTTPQSFTYNPSNNILYISTNSGFYIKFNVLSNTFTIVIYSSCSNYQNKIKYNPTNNRLYATDLNCNLIYEFDVPTDTLLKTYNNLSSNNISQVYGIDIDSLGNTWFSSYDDVFQLGCTTDFITGQTTSNERLQLGNTFFNPILSACCEITQIQSITSSDSYLFGLTSYPSMVNYQDCTTCTGTTHQLFYCQDCTGVFDGILVSTGGTYNIGNFVRSHWGNSDWLCFEIVDVYTFAQYGETIVFEANPEIYGSCEECSSGATIGLTVINCDTLVPQQVNVTLNNWLEITGFPYGLPNQVISDSNGICYQVVNNCPIENNNPTFEPKNFYINQLFCRLGERFPVLPPISAGTEYFACQVCCPCESGGTITQVSVPHPAWTNGQGRTIYLLDAVLLGGQNGLNS